MSFIDKFPGQGGTVCEECKLNEKKSRVYSYHFTNRTEYESYFDEDGVHTQVPTMEISTWVYRCSNGHAWAEASIRRTDRDVVGD